MSYRSKRIPKGFTLVEMLIVIVVLVTLMSITFRLAGIGDESDRRVRTVMRLQRLENCLSGYHAAFGSYPPVKLHGSHDIYLKVGAHGIQGDDRNEDIWNWNKIGEANEHAAWEQVSAACKAQPVACRYPFSSDYSDMIKDVSDEIKTLVQNKEDGYTNLGENQKKRLEAGFENVPEGQLDLTKSDWRDLQLFQFGLMSFLLPRYYFMMNGPEQYFSNNNCKQWVNNNTIPCDPFTGNKYNSWSALTSYLRKTEPTAKDKAQILAIPSQAACARWMPNLEGICFCNHPDYRFFGVNIRYSGGLRPSPDIEIFSNADADSDSTGDQYVLDMITVLDGWEMPLYYYSPPPYQTYTLWSGGANKRTFPPWISRGDLGAKANECINKWTNDDIIHLSN